MWQLVVKKGLKSAAIIHYLVNFSGIMWPQIPVMVHGSEKAAFTRELCGGGSIWESKGKMVRIFCQHIHCFNVL